MQWVQSFVLMPVIRIQLLFYVGVCYTVKLLTSSLIRYHVCGSCEFIAIQSDVSHH